MKSLANLHRSKDIHNLVIITRGKAEVCSSKRKMHVFVNTCAAALAFLVTVVGGKVPHGLPGVDTQVAECLYCHVAVVDVQLPGGRGAKSYSCVTESTQEGDGESEMSYTLTFPQEFIHKRSNKAKIDTGASTICIAGGSAVRTDFGTPDYVVIPSGAAIFFVHGKNIFQRRLAEVGIRSVLVVRVSTKVEEPTQSAVVFANETFGIGGQHVSLASQYKSCSFGKLMFVPAATTKLIKNGVMELKLHQSIKGLDARNLENLMNLRTKGLLGVNSLGSAYSHILFCLPYGTRMNNMTGWIAYGVTGGKYSYYNDGWCSSLSAKMHEIGHNLGVVHSGINNEYSDVTCSMGASTKAAGRPTMCFNGHKNYVFGWYKDKQIVVQPSKTGPVAIKLYGFVDYQNANGYVLIIVGQLYIQFNLAEKFNSQTRKYPNNVTIVKSTGIGKTSNLVRALSPKQSAVIDNYSIDVCALVTSRTPKYMLVSVRLKTQHSACPSGATSAPARK